MILEKIRQCYGDLTKSQKQLADFVATTYREAAFWTASRLADELGLNEATVIRFAQRLGYAGYPQMVADVQRLVQAELGTIPADAEGTSRRLRPMLRREIESLDRISNHIADDATEETLKVLESAKRLLVLGQGVGGPLAELFATGLRVIGMDAASPSTDPISLAMVLREVTEGDVIMTISVALETQELSNALLYAREHGARTVALTWSHTSCCAQAADVALCYLPDETFPLRSCVPLTLILDSLLQVLADATIDSRDRVHEFVQIRDQISQMHP